MNIDFSDVLRFFFDRRSLRMVPREKAGQPLVPPCNLPIAAVIAAESSLRKRHRCHSRLLRATYSDRLRWHWPSRLLLRSAASIRAVRVANGSSKVVQSWADLLSCMLIIFAVFCGQFPTVPLDSFNYTFLPSSGKRLFTNQLSHASGEFYLSPYRSGQQHT
jgi:hypothetical protein